MKDNILSNEFVTIWKLLDGQNHTCEYVCESPQALQERFSKEKILDTAHQVLKLGWMRYAFKLTGGEPTIHPHLIDLTTYLATCGRAVRVALKTNGLAPEKLYRELLRPFSRQAIHLYVDLHLDIIDEVRILRFLNLATEYDQRLTLNFNIVPQYENIALALLQLLPSWREKYDFDVAITYPLSPKAQRDQNFYRNSSKREAKIHTQSNFYIVGSTGAYIDTQGRMSLGLEGVDRPWALTIAQNPNLIAGLPVPMAFADEEDARKTLAQASRTLLNQVIFSPPLRSPFGKEFASSLDLLRNAMRHLEKVGECASHFPPKPQLWQDQKEVIGNIHSILTDMRSREVFLRFLKTAILGDYAYLKSAAAEELDIFHRHMHAVRNTDGTNEILQRAKWQMVPVAFRLELNSPWLEELQNFMEVSPDCNLLLNTDGHSLYVLLVPMGMRHEIRPRPDLVEWSFIFADLETAYMRQDIYESLAQLDISFEIIILSSCEPYQENSTDSPSSWVSCIRHLQPTGSSPGERWNLAILNATGRYLTFEPSMDFLSLWQGYEIMQSMSDSQIHAFVGTKSELRDGGKISGCELLASVLSDSVNIHNIANHIYRRDHLISSALIPMDIAGQCPSSFINVMAFSSAKEMTCKYIPALPAKALEPETITPGFVFGALATFCRLFILEDKISEILLMHYIGRLKPASLHESHLTDDGVASGNWEPFRKILVKFLEIELAHTRSVSWKQVNQSQLQQVICKNGAQDYRPGFKLGIIVELAASPPKQLLECIRQSPIYDVQWIIVNNGGSEATLTMLQDLCWLYPNIHLSHFVERVPHGAILKAAGEILDSQWVWCLDSYQIPMFIDVRTILANLTDNSCDAQIYGRQGLAVTYEDDQLENYDVLSLLENIIDPHSGIALTHLIFNAEFFSSFCENVNPFSILPKYSLIKSLTEERIICNNLDINIRSYKFTRYTDDILDMSSLEDINNVYEFFALFSSGIKKESFAYTFFREVWLPMYKAYIKKFINQKSIPKSTTFTRCLIEAYLSRIVES